MRFLGVFWGIAGIMFLLVYAVIRLSFVFLEALTYEFHWYHWLVLGSNVLFMAYSEGYRGFQKNFSPRVAARVRYLFENPRALHVFLAPVFCMGYFYISKSRQRVIIGLTLGICMLIIFVRSFLDQPMRGIIDAGVVVGLSWGIISLIVFIALAFTSMRFSYTPDMPEPSLPLKDAG